MNEPRTVFTVAKDFDFECAHILEKGCNAACANTIHGHSYKATIAITANRLNEQGMVFDFSLFNETIRVWREHMDHALVIPVSREAEFVSLSGNVHCMEENPTAENFALMLMTDVERMIDKLGVERKLGGNSIVSVAITIWETAKCRAIVTRIYPTNNEQGEE